MPLSWNEIRHRAIGFSKEWSGAKSERAEKQTFWNEFFEVFGIRRRVVATFEEPVKRVSGTYGFIDLFWPGVVLIEHKSLAKNLAPAETQAFAYIHDLAREGRFKEIPRYVVVSDFNRIALHDLEPDDQRSLPLFEGRRVDSYEFPLAEFHHHIHRFGFIPGYQQHKFEDQDPINIEAVEILGNLHDKLEDGGYAGHQLERFLVRVLFCLFAEDTGIFEREAFRLYIINKTAADGSDLGLHLARLFDVLNTPPEKRQKNLDESLADFAYVNGDLFAESLGFADFNADMRKALLECTEFNWARISPAIFGSLFQAVMEPRERRQIGGHYTSERDILKLVRSLFLDELRTSFEKAKGNRAELKRFHERISELRFLDPACGCGNFLVITYRELRLLEIEILKLLYPDTSQPNLDIQRLSLVDVDKFYGIEISEWPARIAEVALWLMDHQMNIQLSEAFGQYFVRLPLTKSPTIECANALRMDWNSVLSAAECDYVLGNPPFIGHTYQSNEQKEDQDHVLRHIRGSGVLDYVSNWYVKAAEYIQGTDVQAAFVSTNSITQGEQVGLLWTEMFGRYRVKISFAHRTFPWASEARGQAHVHVVIIGFSLLEVTARRIYEYNDEGQLVGTITARNISPYLIEGSDRVVTNRRDPLSNVPRMIWGNKPTDGGHFLLTDEQKQELIALEPKAAKFIRQYMGAEELLYSIKRWCLWLTDISPQELNELEEIKTRVEKVKEFRSQSKAATTREYAAYPTLFRQIAQPTSDYLAVPEVSSEKRAYIPIGFLPSSVICSNRLQVVPGASMYHFGILSSAMHMAWMRQVCGRLESRYLYSNTIVYNNFPWPNSNDKQAAMITSCAEKVLQVRSEFPESTLADLYDPISMPPALVNAHAALDRAVDLAYRPQRFETERQRIQHLFALYEQAIAPLTTPPRGARRGAAN